MPSGSKKRKAAKKKKEIQSSNHSNSLAAHSHGLKNAGVEEQKIVVEEEDNVVQAGKEFTIENESDNKNGKVEHDEPARISCDGSMSGSSSSCVSSDAESHGIEVKKATIVNVPVVDSAKSADSLSESPVKAVYNVVVEEASDSMNCPAVNGEKTVSSIKYKAGVSEGSVDAASVRKDEEAIVQSVENAATVSESMEHVAQENYDRMALSYNAPRVTANNGARGQDSGVTEPLLAPAPHPVQTTSWKSCCGLFEMFTGSGR